MKPTDPSGVSQVRKAQEKIFHLKKWGKTGKFRYSFGFVKNPAHILSKL